MPFDHPLPTVTYHVEPWSAVLHEMQPMWAAHWAEVGLDRDTVPLAMDYAKYAALEAQGVLHVVTARKDDVLIGYLVAIVQTHLHYATTLFSVFDLFYLTPKERSGWRGVNLFRAAERTLRARGVSVVHANTKIHASPVMNRTLDVGPIFKFLGWAEAEHVYRKKL